MLFMTSVTILETCLYAMNVRSHARLFRVRHISSNSNLVAHLIGSNAKLSSLDGFNYELDLDLKI